MLRGEIRDHKNQLSEKKTTGQVATAKMEDMVVKMPGLKMMDLICSTNSKIMIKTS